MDPKCANKSRLRHPSASRLLQAMLVLPLVVGAVFAVLALTLTPANVEAAPAVGGTIEIKLAPGTRLAATDEGLLTVIKDWKSLDRPDLDASGVPLRESGELPQIGVHLLKAASGGGAADLEAQANRLRLMPGVLWAEVSQPMHASRVPNDPLYFPGDYSSVGQWALSRVGLPRAWDTTTGSSGVTLAVLDTGLNRDIPDFSGRLVSPYDVVTDSAAWPAWGDNHGHGSAVAGIAAAAGDNGQAIAGAAWGVNIMPVKISDNGESDTSLLATAITYAADHGADVINISFAGPASTPTLAVAVAYALSEGAVIVASSGNEGRNTVGYPAALAGVIGVGATDSADARMKGAVSSNYGEALDIVAPGKDIISFGHASPSSFGYWSGTSCSAPLVSGVAALMLSVKSSLTPEQVTEILDQSADDVGPSGWDEEFGWGLLDADEAVLQAANGAAPTTTTSSTTTTTTTTTSTSSTTTTSTTSTSTTSTTTTSTSTTPTTVEQPHFPDVQPANPYFEQIEYLASLDIVSGSTDGLFHPDAGLMRQQFAKVILLTLGYPVTTEDVCPFKDVSKSGGDELYPDHFVAVALARGITQGTDASHFSPYRTLTRAQMITMVARAAQVSTPPADYVPPFANFSPVHYPYARAAAYAGLLDRLQGMGPTYDFLAPASRGEVCALLYEFLQ